MNTSLREICNIIAIMFSTKIKEICSKISKRMSQLHYHQLSTRVSYTSVHRLKAPEHRKLKGHSSIIRKHKLYVEGPKLYSNIAL